MTRSCAHCKAPFDTKHPRVVTCSDHCKAEHRRIGKNQWNADRHRIGPVSASCETCAVEFIKVNGRQLYCTDRCRLAKGTDAVPLIPGVEFSGFREDDPFVSIAPPILSCPHQTCRRYGGHHASHCPTREPQYA